MIELKNIVKTFIGKGNDIHAVRGVDLTIEDGEIFGIIGYSGAGKSTLVRLINQLETQTSGEIYIEGEEISHLSPSALRKKRMKIGMIFQHFNLLWSRTVAGNIELPLEIAGVDKEKRQARVQELIQLVGLVGRENAYPSELSGGQKQRVGIARALANNPSILLCDEATSALDPETTDSILELLNDINQKLGITIVMITHQLEVVQKICHRIAVMSEGEVVETGSVQEVFENPKHAVTKRFIQSIDGTNIEELKKDLKKAYPYGQIFRLTFSSNNSDKPILAEVMRKIDLPISIVDSNIHHTRTGPIGSMYVHVGAGSPKDYDRLVELLKEYKVKVEVI
ncbi:MAG: ATP-binding cassette domain-containing protein [Erysipelotrichales bacterium]|nr:ATP-binding cassette domain-containing protein [Erysipelotrichales bacterium]